MSEQKELFPTPTAEEVKHMHTARKLDLMMDERDVAVYALKGLRGRLEEMLKQTDAVLAAFK